MGDQPSYAAIGMDSRAGQPTIGSDDGESGQGAPVPDPGGPPTGDLDAWIEHGDVVLLTRAEREQGTQLSVEQLFGRAILRLRLYFGWSQRELGRRSRLDQSTISRVERGRQPGLSLKRLFAICRALRIVDVDLVTRKPSVPPTELEIMLGRDRWTRAVAAADRKLRAGHGTLTPGDR